MPDNENYQAFFIAIQMPVIYLSIEVSTQNSIIPNVINKP